MSEALIAPADLRIVLFSGGRGAGALTELMATDQRVSLTVAINGYDDGASTGRIRRFLGDSLGPSDFRKNASRLARLRQSCPSALIDLLDSRLPAHASEAEFGALLDRVRCDASYTQLNATHTRKTPSAVVAAAVTPAARRDWDGAEALESSTRAAVASRLQQFWDESRRVGGAFDFDDSSVGNLVFAGAFLMCDRRFDAAVDDYCAMLGLPVGLIENVTDGTNAFLVALDESGRLLASEEEIVDAKRRNTVREIFLIDHPLTADERAAVAAMSEEARRQRLQLCEVRPPANPRLLSRVADAQLIVYAPGTQHSSLFPSYLTTGLGDTLASNLTAVKLLVTNIQEDAEITGRSAVELVDRAVFYLREKGRLSVPTPCLITHYLLNDPGQHGSERPYVPLGRLESIEDPRLVRIGNYEEGASGHHDAAKVLAPFIDGFIARQRSVQRVAVVCYETTPTKLAETILEMLRAGIQDLRIDLEIFHGCNADLEPTLRERLPCPVRRLTAQGELAQDRELREHLVAGHYDYVILFESSGMYHGEDIVGLASHLTLGRLDAVWGSRRLSVRDIQESYRLRYRHHTVLGAVSAIGSHALSLAYLALYGRYVSDTLSSARAVRASDALTLECPLTHKLVNQYLLSALLRRRAEMLEVPVQFFGMSPERVRRTSVFEGLAALGVALSQRFSRGEGTQAAEASDVHGQRGHGGK